MSELQKHTVADLAPTNADWQARKTAAIARGQGNMAAVYIERAVNAELWDVEGQRYIDFGTGIAVCSTGHSTAICCPGNRRQTHVILMSSASMT